MQGAARGCLACGWENPLGSSRCANCGAALTVKCPACSDENPVAANFCGRCGQRLRPAETGSGSSADRVRDDVRVLDNRAERRQITVMFCDLVGSVSLSEELDPEDLTEVIVAYRNAVHSIIDDLGGYIARYLGDGLLIYFGYPQAYEDDAVRAVRAALRIIQDVNSLAARRRLPIKSPLQTHIGVHTGLVVVGELGTGTARERDGIIGETPNVAARLEKLAEPDTVLISAATYELVARHFHCTQLPAQPVDGIPQLLDIYYVRAEIEHFGEIRPRVREAIRIVDRKQELRLLRAGWGQAKRGRGGVFVLSGEPGVGKSRLTRALIEDVARNPPRILSCFCSSENAGSAFVPVADMLRRELGLGRSAVQFDDFRRLAVALESSGLPEEAISALALFLSLKLPDSVQPPLLSPEGLRQRTMEWLGLWLSRQADDRPVLFLVEDIHWADASTLEWLDQIARLGPTAQIMMVTTVRTECRRA